MDTIRKTTPELRPGDMVFLHGMVIEVGEGQEVIRDVWVFKGSVQNADAICEADSFIRSFLRGCNARKGERDRWDIQGNQLAYWTVLLGHEGGQDA